MSKKGVVFGSFVVDLMGRGDHLPKPGETVFGNYFKQGPGGKGFNQGVAAFKSGSDIQMITKIGQDLFSEVLISTMEELGMDQTNILVSEEHPTGIALISVDENTSENQILVVPGACSHITDKDIESVQNLIQNADYLLLQLETNVSSIEKVMQIAKESNVKIILNTAPIQPVSDEILKGLYLVTPNEVEAEYLTGIKITDEKNAELAAKKLMAKGIQNVVITLGKKGAYIYSDEYIGIIPAFKVEAVDTTGAGDAFNGGLLTGLLEGKSLKNAAMFGNAVGALSVKKMGTTPAMPNRNEIDNFLSEQI
ncbi:ribokinase [Facklamia sp. DSM 111018]|uniref:Ribokinase n=1 Tax=Facklamia lactis TaxID=2749967 RepID=A0ABS0LQR5_9LACT|nr:ribokinase [Facklamia lactis]MBG9980558.1 ribokinase [Facklamia lactis]MBG9986367.1 ribokinase [Facklamia lactis]